ncbi:MAG: hypothetical protein R6U51_10430 [Anaerolineales bacterium]
MKGKWRILTVIFLAGLHALVTYLLLLRSFPIVMGNFDSPEPYTLTEKLTVNAMLVLIFPYHQLLLSTIGLLPRSEVFHIVMLGVNSLLWGIGLDWFIRMIWGMVKSQPSQPLDGRLA